ncbi:DUF4430 domain-containing protein [Streptococcus sp. zg-JUN1979]|uniref:DUF4430 domain-containing protein n=1 Tax=Streptococcus sp. zg-JUN1979 TaxID=3391450 RepID=UPI0039A5D39F
MKRYAKYIFLTLLSVVLVACSNTTTTNTSQSSEQAGKVELVVKEDSNTLDETVTFSDGETVLDVLKDNYKVEEKSGFITAIDGISQDEAAGKYWMFKVNDKVADKAANQIKVKDGDKIEFYQEVYSN